MFPNKKSFNGKKGVGKKARYLSIKKRYLINDLWLSYQQLHLLLKRLSHIHCSLAEQISINNFVVHKDEKDGSVFFDDVDENVLLQKNNNKLKSVVKFSNLEFSDNSNHE